MSLFEWLGESFNPKNIGEVSKETPSKKSKPNFKININFIISVLLILGYYYLWLNNDSDFNLKKITIISILLLGYLAIAYNFKVKPDYENIGLFGTPINHPFRISDNFNRFLMIIEFILIPGRYISSSIMNFIFRFRN